MSFFSDIWDFLRGGTPVQKQLLNDYNRQVPQEVGSALNTAAKYNPITLVGNAAASIFHDSPPAPPPIIQPTLGGTPDIGPFNNSQSQFPSMADIMARLQQLNDPSRYMVDSNSLMKQAIAAASAQYDPIIANLRGAESLAQTRANRNKTALGEMFSQLSDSLQGDIPAVQQNYAQTKQNTQQAYNDLNQKIGATYQQAQADQEAMLKRLGIEAAAPDIMAKQAADKTFFENSANQEAQTAQTALDTEQRGNTEYTRRGSEIARTEGTQRQADLMSQLQDLLSQYDTQIGANEAAKAQAIQAGLGQLTQQAQERATTNAQRDFNNYLSTIQLGRQLREDDLKQLLAGQVKKTQSPADVAGRALTLGLNQGDAQNIQNAFNNAIASDPVILSGLDASSGSPAPKEALAARVVQKGREAGLSQQQLNALQTIALEYFGRV